MIFPNVITQERGDNNFGEDNTIETKEYISGN